jgi:predicted secreted hydrolase
MKNSLASFAAALLVLQPSTQVPPAQYRIALPVYRYEFPRDHFDHPDFYTEWWSYTANVN